MPLAEWSSTGLDDEAASPSSFAYLQLEAVLDLAPDAMLIAASDGRIRLTNRMLESLLGYERHELDGQTVETLLPIALADAHRRHRENFLRNPLTRAMGSGLRLRARRKTGDELPVEVSLRPVYLGRDLVVCAALRDVSLQRLAEEQLRASEERLRFVVENAPDIIFIQDLDLRYQWLSQLPREMSGEDFLGKTDLDHACMGLFSDADAARLTVLKREVLSSGSKCERDVEIAIRGSPRIFEVTYEPMRNAEGRITGLLGYLHDRTQERETLRALEAARAEAERVSRRNARFLAIASHDLRQPVQTLSMLIAASRRVDDPVLLRELQGRIDAALESLKEMLDALLNMTRIESAQFNSRIEDVDLEKVLARLRSDMEPLANSRGLHLHFIGPCGAVRTDRAQCQQILQNLVGNAIKYTDQGGVTVRCRQEAEHELLQVCDTGVGIPRDALAGLFGEFTQLSGPGRVRGGVGLGLWIVKRLADRLGIQISVDSVEGQGTTFTLRIPRATGQPLPSAQSVAARTPGAAPRRPGGRLLLIEDDAAVRSSTAMFLKVEGYEIETAANLAEARERILAAPRPFDLVITDLHLGPTDHGVDAIALARSHHGRMLPAIILSGDTSRAAAEQRALPCTRFLDKPVDVELLLRSLSELLTADRAGVNAR